MRRALIAVVVASSLVAGVATAHASWLSGGSGTATPSADTMPAGATPTASVSGSDVTVSWDESTFSDGTPVEGYEVRRYDADTGDPQTVGAGCDGTVTALTCTETSVPEGDWQYTVEPVHHNWQGTESTTKSSAVTVGAGATAVRVAGLVDASTRSGSSNNWQPTATVIVRNNLGSAVSGVTVTGDFSLTNQTGRTCVTGTTGECNVAIQGNTSTTPVTFTVTSLSHATLAYDAAANTPNPPTITLNRPPPS